MRDFEKLLQAGNKAQMEKLEMNNHKDDFDNLTFEYTFNRLIDEAGELREAFEIENVNINGLKNIRHEAADVANFAHMIILHCDELIKDLQEIKA